MEGSVLHNLRINLFFTFRFLKYEIILKVHIVSIDCGSSATLVSEAFTTAINEAKKPVDVLINCAGTSVPGVFEELSGDVFENMMRVNYFGSVRSYISLICCSTLVSCLEQVFPTRCVVPAMKANGCGRIVFVSSQAGQVLQNENQHLLFF